MTAARTPTWGDALELVRQLVAAGHPHAVVEAPGLRLELSTMDSPTDEPARASGPAGELVPVVAPVVGTFYRRPAPSQPPFVEVGDEVRDDTVVGIVEVMKMMVPVEAGVAGRIARACVADASAVEEGQALFEVEPLAVRSEDPHG